MSFKEIKSLEEIVPHEGGKINSISVSKTGELRGIDIEPVPEVDVKKEQLDEVGQGIAEDFEKAEYGIAKAKSVSNISWNKYERRLDRIGERNDDKTKKPQRQAI